MKAIAVVILCFSAFLAMAPFARAQKNPPKHIRFLALGELWTWSETLDKKTRKGEPPPPGANPPAATALVSGDQAVPFRFNLRSFTKLLTMAGSTPKLEIKAGTKEAYETWLSSPMPAAPLSLGVVYRDPATMLWNNPKFLLLKDDKDSFKPGQIRFVNVSNKVALVKLGNDGFKLPPGKSVIKPIKVGSTPLMLGYQNGGEQVVLEQNTTRVLTNQRVQVFFFQARDPESSTGPVRTRQMFETVPKLPKAPKAP
jgi:hypothetical protein